MRRHIRLINLTPGILDIPVLAAMGVEEIESMQECAKQVFSGFCCNLLDTGFLSELVKINIIMRNNA